MTDELLFGSTRVAPKKRVDADYEFCHADLQSALEELLQMKKTDALDQMYRDLAEKENSYRTRALKMYPHVCGSCGREFSGKGLKELTVHHKDHNHDNNPPDGSNWELLCIYCHDNEHEKHKMKGYSSAEKGFEAGKFSTFEGLDALLGNAADKKK